MAVALRIFVTVLIATLFLPGSWNLAAAWVFNPDLRKAANFSQVGVIEFNLPEGRSTGTAFLVGECLVMTNFHVAFGPWYLTQLQPPSNTNKGTFTLTQVTLLNGRHPSTGAIPFMWGDYLGPQRQFKRPANDWVLLALEDCLGSWYGFLLPYEATLDDDMPDSGGFTAFGYSTGRQMVDSDCSIRLGGGSGSAATMLNDCAALHGDSGAPIIRRGTNRVVAMISGFHAGSSISCTSFNGVVYEPWSPQCTNGAIPFSASLIEQIERANWDTYAQSLLLRLGYDAGDYGVIDQLLLARAIKEVQTDMGMRPTGKMNTPLGEILRIRNLGI